MTEKINSIIIIPKENNKFYSCVPISYRRHLLLDITYYENPEIISASFYDWSSIYAPKSKFPDDQIGIKKSVKRIIKGKPDGFFITCGRSKASKQPLEFTYSFDDIGKYIVHVKIIHVSWY